MRQKSEKSAEKWSFEITNPYFCHAYTAKRVYYPQSVLSSRNTHVHARILQDFCFFAVTSVTAAKQKHIHFQRNNTSFVVKQHVVCGKTTRRLW